jgi:hypothetical protein
MQTDLCSVCSFNNSSVFITMSMLGASGGRTGFKTHSRFIKTVVFIETCRRSSAAIVLHRFHFANLIPRIKMNLTSGLRHFWRKHVSAGMTMSVNRGKNICLR